MKKLFTYIIVFCLFNINVEAEQLSISEINLGNKITNYFTSEQILTYYDTKLEKEIFGKDKKYSVLNFGESDLFKNNYNNIQIYYENKSNIIVAISTVIFNPEDCKKLRDQKILEYRKKTINLKPKSGIQTFSDGLKDDYVYFDNIFKKSFMKFSCYYYPKYTDFRTSNMTNEYNKWIFAQFD